jgi:hypothetical protein
MIPLRGHATTHIKKRPSLHKRQSLLAVFGTDRRTDRTPLVVGEPIAFDWFPVVVALLAAVRQDLSLPIPYAKILTDEGT